MELFDICENTLIIPRDLIFFLFKLLPEATQVVEIQNSTNATATKDANGAPELCGNKLPNCRLGLQERPWTQAAPKEQRKTSSDPL